MKRIMIFASCLLVSMAAKAQLFINEISHGADGNKDYVEFVVAGTRSCTDSTMDLRGIIVDDNAGWYGTTSFNEGAFRFVNDANWSAVPYGSVILVYSSDDKNSAITLADDPTDANHDYIYVLADTSQFLEVSAEPAVMNSAFDYSIAISGSWAPFTPGSVAGSLLLDDSTDVVSIINPSVSTSSATHSVAWGSLALGTGQPAAIQIAGNPTGAFNLYNTGNSPATQSLWTIGDAGVPGQDDETPGAGNTNTNINWIDSMRVQASVPAAPGSISGPATLCVGTTGNYVIASVAGAPSYNWTMPGVWAGSSTDTSITITVMSSGVLSVTAENACGSSTAVHFNVVANIAPPTPTVILGSNSLCAGATETYSVPSAGLSSLVWTIPNSWTGLTNGNDISCSVGSTGGTVSAIITDVCGASTTLTLPVTVNAYVTPSVTITTANMTVCSYATTTFNALSLNGGTAASYQWLLNGNPAGVSGPAFNINTLQTNDSVSVILTSSEECLTSNNVHSNQIAMQVIPSVVPSIQISAFPGNTVCQGTKVTFVSSDYNGGSNPGYLWYKNGSLIPGAQSHKYSTNTLNSGDTIYAALISSVVCPSKDTMPGNSLGLTINPLVNPTVKINASHAMPVHYGTAVTFTATYSGGGAAPGFQWLRNGKPLAFETSAVYTSSNLKKGDTISLRMTSNDPCPVTTIVYSNEIRVANTATTGIDAASANGTIALRVFPNPSKGQFTLELDPGSIVMNEKFSIEVVNLMGQIVYRAELSASAQGKTSISLSDGIAKGMYQLRLRSAKLQASRQLMIQ